jgi:hypothetical protein
MVCIGSNDVEAVKFGRRLVEFGLTWTQTPYSLLVWNLEDSKLSDTPGLVELDLEYDVDKDLDSCEALSKVVWVELGVYKALSNCMRSSVWSTLWRTLRYNMMAVTNEVMMQLIESRSIFLKCRKLSEHRMKKRIISFLIFILIDIPSEIYEGFHALAYAAADYNSQGSTTDSPGQFETDECSVF